MVLNEVLKLLLVVSLLLESFDEVLVDEFCPGQEIY